MDMRIGNRPYAFATVEQRQALRQQVEGWNTEVETDFGDEFKQGFPAVRTEFYGPTLNVLKDQGAQVLSPLNTKLKDYLLAAGISISGSALLGQTGAALQLMLKDGAMQVLYSDASGSQALESTPAKRGSPMQDGYVVDLPTGRQVSFRAENTRLTIHSADEFGEIASSFNLADRTDDGSRSMTMNMKATSVGNEGLLSGISLVPAEKQGDADRLQLFSLHEDRERGTLRGQVYGRYGSIYSELDPNFTHQRVDREEDARDEAQDPEYVVKMAVDSARAADNFLIHNPGMHPPK